MQNKIIYFLALVIFVLMFSVLFGGDNFSEGQEKMIAKVINEEVDRVEVIHFHGSRQCWSCITVGEMALRTIEKNFVKEYEEGRVVFMDVNGELPENAELVKKYQARGSSLFVNTVINGKDNIKENVAVWRLIHNEERFNDHLTAEIMNSLMK